jgi:multidrug efflux system membrane fusion protein
MKKTAVCLVLLLCTATSFLAGCSGQNKKEASKPVPVMAAIAAQRAVPVQINAIGTVEAFQTISVRSQITGLITGVHFKEGQDVKKGDLLIELDCRSNEAALREARANLAKDRAQAENARVNLERYTTLLEKDFVSREEYDQVKTNLATLEAAIKADEAIVQNNSVQVQYCSIRSPIGGRTGRLQVDQGNIAKADDMEIVTINQMQPIRVTFSIPEKDLPRVKEYSAGKGLEVEAHLPGQDLPEKGELSFVDNAVDRATGTITLKGTFANAAKRLIPGQFVDVVLKLTVMPDAVVVPTQSVAQGQEGQYIYVVTSDSKAEMRTITAGQSLNGQTVVVKGVKAGEKVVTDGQMRLTPGAKVALRNMK